MGLISRIVGTVSSFFQIGGPSGPSINDNAGTLEAVSALSPAIYTDFRAQLFEYQQAVPAGKSITVPSGNTILLAQDFTNNGHIALQGTSRMVWVR